MRYCIETLGCKVNQYETQALETMLRARGHTPAAPDGGCDAVIVNTCAVTAESGRKSRQAVRRLQSLAPGALVAVCGCFSQVSPEETAALGADLISGSGDRAAFVEALERLYHDRQEKSAVSELSLDGSDRTEAIDRIERLFKLKEKPVFAVDKPIDGVVGPSREIMIDNPAERRVFEELPAGSVSGRTRAMLKIEDGCRNFCAYCIIPYARGPVRSLSLERVAGEARRLNSEGYGEIVVTGIEISSYGKDFENGTTLLDAVRAVSAAAPDARIRLGSLEPRTITEDFVMDLKQLPNICDHFHLSLQSGCDATLARMKRKYSTDEFYRAVCLLRRYFPDCGVTADLIVGFPGETEEEFEATMAFIRKCAFSSMHIFPYSVRPGTLAERLPGQVDKSVKQARARQAAAAAREMAREYRRNFVGAMLEVIFEREEDGVSFGHAGNFLEVGAAGTALRHKRLSVRISYEKSGLLFGEINAPRFDNLESL